MSGTSRTSRGKSVGSSSSWRRSGREWKETPSSSRRSAAWRHAQGLLRKLAEAEQSAGHEDGADVRAADRIETPEPERPRRKATRKSRSAPSPAAGVARRKTDPGAERRSDPGGMQASVVRSTRRFLLSVCAELRSLQPTEASAPGTISEDSLPRLDETCGACGKVLLSSVLGGESVSCRAGRWYHRRCLPGRDGRGRPGARSQPAPGGGRTARSWTRDAPPSPRIPSRASTSPLRADRAPSSTGSRRRFVPRSATRSSSMPSS